MFSRRFQYTGLQIMHARTLVGILNACVVIFVATLLEHCKKSASRNNSYALQRPHCECALLLW